MSTGARSLKRYKLYGLIAIAVLLIVAMYLIWSYLFRPGPGRVWNTKSDAVTVYADSRYVPGLIFAVQEKYDPSNTPAPDGDVPSGYPRMGGVLSVNLTKHMSIGHDEHETHVFIKAEDQAVDLIHQCAQHIIRGNLVKSDNSQRSR